MKNHTITGGGGIKLHVLETGNAKQRPIVFVHGFSQCSHAWIRQLNSDLANTFRLIAMDLRGHGQSEKPLDGYADSRLWADDVQAVIQALDLDRPVLCGWSYGPLVILDYVRHYGEDAIGGLNFVGGVTKLGSDEAASVLTAACGLSNTELHDGLRKRAAFDFRCPAKTLTITDLATSNGLPAGPVTSAGVDGCGRRGTYIRAPNTTTCLPDRAGKSRSTLGFNRKSRERFIRMICWILWKGSGGTASPLSFCTTTRRGRQMLRLGERAVDDDQLGHAQP
jgi:pimeloyl-ACP methyl ester carboxylesterase